MGKSLVLKEIVKTRSKPISISNYPTIISLKISRVWLNKWLLRLKVATILTGVLALLSVAYQTQSNHFETLLVMTAIITLTAIVALLSNTNKK